MTTHPRETPYPIHGLALRRWRWSIRLHQFACAVGGRHRRQLIVIHGWNDIVCPRCGWIESDGDPEPWTREWVKAYLRGKAR